MPPATDGADAPVRDAEESPSSRSAGSTDNPEDARVRPEGVDDVQAVIDQYEVIIEERTRRYERALDERAADRRATGLVERLRDRISRLF